MPTSFPSIQPQQDHRAEAHNNDPARDILSVMSLRDDLQAAFRAGVKEASRREPTSAERQAFRQRLFASVSPARFFYEHAENNLYRPVEILRRDEPDDPDLRWTDLPQMLRCWPTKTTPRAS